MGKKMPQASKSKCPWTCACVIFFLTTLGLGAALIYVTIFKPAECQTAEARVKSELADCRNQTSLLQLSITAQRNTIVRLEARGSELEQRERGEMAALRQQLQETQRQRDQHLQEVRELRRQLSRQSSGGADLRLHSLGLLALPLAAALLS
ncbi:uncharacterized protein LOC109284015 [Alligator mississippiensis]|uniref:Bone marrow stromal antigen 2 n=1 Tax=Alligator mississippiensis TaxID=8496 RepID=A0A151NDK1_ALLMI|nr:uncharacterized protein LOC109284015 [Alligator mississippiensis]KYO34719.1 hypothetical protein Y1Q_0004238 [Alligator mississippiensis]